jgi:hypothetical protein
MMLMACQGAHPPDLYCVTHRPMKCKSPRRAENRGWQQTIRYLSLRGDHYPFLLGSHTPSTSPFLPAKRRRDRAEDGFHRLSPIAGYDLPLRVPTRKLVVLEVVP